MIRCQIKLAVHDSGFPEIPMRDGILRPKLRGSFQRSDGSLLPGHAAGRASRQALLPCPDLAML